MEEGARVHHSYGSYAPSTYGSYEPREANPSTGSRRIAGDPGLSTGGAGGRDGRKAAAAAAPETPRDGALYCVEPSHSREGQRFPIPSSMKPYPLPGGASLGASDEYGGVHVDWDPHRPPPPQVLASRHPAPRSQLSWPADVEHS